TLEDVEGGRAQDRQSDLRSHAVDLDQHLEHLELLGRGEAEERELVLANVRVNVELDRRTHRAHLLADPGGNAHQVADSACFHQHLVGSHPAHGAPQITDEFRGTPPLAGPGKAIPPAPPPASPAASPMRRERAWRTAVAIASTAWAAPWPPPPTR